MPDSLHTKSTGPGGPKTRGFSALKYVTVMFMMGVAAVFVKGNTGCRGPAWACLSLWTEDTCNIYYN